MSQAQLRLELWDYVTCTILVLLSSSVGVYHVFANRKSQNATEFLMKSRDLGVGPLILSAAATFTSAIGFLAVPVETYTNGVSFMVSNITMLLVIPIGVFLYLPVFYNLELSSIFEYLEVRFNRTVRLCASTLINLQMLRGDGIPVTFQPPIFEVTGMHLWASVAAVGVICIIYTSLGGIKAVVWADATQVVVMILVVLFVLFKGSSDLGGIAEIWRISTEGKRSQFFVFTAIPYSNYTFWTMIFGTTLHYTANIVTNQLLVQRYICNKTLRKAKLSFIGGTIVTDLLFVCTSLGGLMMYARYHDCDPLMNNQVTSRDQIMAVFAMETLGFCSGLPGIFIAAILCATISTLSSTLNSLSTISMEDYIKPSFPTLSDSAQMWLSKILAMVYGVVCIALVLVAQNIDGIIQAVFMINGVSGGPVLAVFTIGMALPFVNSWGAISGFIAAFLLAGWASIGSLIMKPTLPKAPFSVSGCNVSAGWLSNQSEFMSDNVTFASTMEIPTMPEPDVLALYSLPSLWYTTWSCGIAIVVSIIVSILTGPRKVEDVDPQLLFPFIRTLCKKLPKNYNEILEHDKEKKSYLQLSMRDPDLAIKPDKNDPKERLGN